MLNDVSAVTRPAGASEATGPLREDSPVKAFCCRVCDAALYFENSVCVTCGSPLGFSREERAIVPLDDRGRYVDAQGLIWHLCANRDIAGCTWLARIEGGLCSSCGLTRTRPNDRDEGWLEAFRVAEVAKRHLVYELDGLGLPMIGKHVDAEEGLAFDLLASADREVVIGHDRGVITLDLAESDDAHRERVRVDLDEPYRTMLGHFRHEVGHYYEWQLVRGEERLESCRRLFGDESEDYQEAIARHYAGGPPEDWRERYLSTYASMHPFEDFAETFAHYLHICDAIETASAYGLTRVGAVQAFSSFRDLVLGVWLPLAVALNQINRSMGKEDLYPFVIPDPVIDKLAFVATLAPGR